MPEPVSESNVVKERIIKILDELIDELETHQMESIIIFLSLFFQNTNL